MKRKSILCLITVLYPYFIPLDPDPYSIPDPGKANEYGSNRIRIHIPGIEDEEQIKLYVRLSELIRIDKK